MKGNKTQPHSGSIKDFLDTVSDKRQDESHQLITIMQDISGLKPVLWGPSIIGFGSQHYVYDTGREGDMPILSFSPRKSAITVYFSDGFEHYSKELAQLGKHKISVSCLYISSLKDINLDVLTKMLRLAFVRSQKPKQKLESVEAYINQVPEVARPQFDTLRQIVRQTLPDATEVVSYGIIGYKVDQKRARVFVSGWKDHVSVYPIPKDQALQVELAPYIKGKGTLWFALDAPLPKDLIKRTALALAA